MPSKGVINSEYWTNFVANCSMDSYNSQILSQTLAYFLSYDWLWVFHFCIFIRSLFDFLYFLERSHKHLFLSTSIWYQMKDYHSINGKYHKFIFNLLCKLFKIIFIYWKHFSVFWRLFIIFHWLYFVFFIGYLKVD